MDKSSDSEEAHTMSAAYARVEGAESETAPKSHRLVPSTRLFTLMLVFLMGLLCSAFQANFNFSLVCIVNASALTVDSDHHSVSPCGDVIEPQVNVQYFGEKLWSRYTQGNLLAATAWASLFFAIPTGVLVFHLGARTLFLCVVSVGTCACVLTPVAVIYVESEWPTFILRLLTGFTILPCIVYTLTRWAPVPELGTLMAIASTGFPLGTIIADLVAGYSCSFRVNSWLYAYVFWGVVGVALLSLFFFAFKNDPIDSNIISLAERRYILAKRKANTNPYAGLREKRIPWARLFSSMPVLACYIGNFTSAWLYFFVADFLPTYIKEALRFDATWNGLLSSLPFLMQLISYLVMGFLSDKSERLLGRTVSIKVFATIAFGVPCVCFIAITQLPCGAGAWAVALFAVALFAFSAIMGGHVKAYSCVAPAYASIVSSVSSTSGSIAGLLVPYVVGVITADGALENWNLCFYVSTGVIGVGLLLFVVMSSGTAQTWAEQPPPRSSCEPTVELTIVDSKRE